MGKDLLMERLEGLVVLGIFSDLAKFPHRLRSQRLGINPHGAPVLRRHIDAMTRASSFELVRVYLLR